MMLSGNAPRLVASGAACRIGGVKAMTKDGAHRVAPKHEPDGQGPPNAADGMARMRVRTEKAYDMYLRLGQSLDDSVGLIARSGETMATSRELFGQASTFPSDAHVAAPATTRSRTALRIRPILPTDVQPLEQLFARLDTRWFRPHDL